MDNMYSEKLKSKKVLKNQNGEYFVGFEIGKDEIVKMIDSFCRKEDVIGVPVKAVSDLFEEFCEENNLVKISPIIFGKIIREHFGLKRKRIRNKDDILWVYVDGGYLTDSAKINII